MKYVSATEVQNHFGKYLKEAMMGEKIVITKNGKAIAQLVSETNKNQFVVDRLRGILKDGPSLEETRKERLKDKYGFDD